MKPLRSSIILACLTAVFGAANAQTSPTANADSRYVGRMSDRYLAFAGSSTNFEALAVGLRHGSRVTLNEGTPSETFFDPPTRPMGYGNITRAIDLASRQLAAGGITDPTPAEIQAAMMGGSCSRCTGGVPLQGVLQLRNQGMGWGEIAHAIGVHPGLRSGSAAAAGKPAASGITTAAGNSVSAAKLKGASSSASDGRGRSGIVTGAGGAPAAGGSNAFGQGHGNAFGQGHGNAFGRGGKP